MADWVSRESYDSLQREYQLALARAAELQVSIDDAIDLLLKLPLNAALIDLAAEVQRVVDTLKGKP